MVSQMVQRLRGSGKKSGLCFESLEVTQGVGDRCGEVMFCCNQSGITLQGEGEQRMKAESQ